MSDYDEEEIVCDGYCIVSSCQNCLDSLSSRKANQGYKQGIKYIAEDLRKRSGEAFTLRQDDKAKILRDLAEEYLKLIK